MTSDYQGIISDGAPTVTCCPLRVWGVKDVTPDSSYLGKVLRQARGADLSPVLVPTGHGYRAYQMGVLQICLSIGVGCDPELLNGGLGIEQGRREPITDMCLTG